MKRTIYLSLFTAYYLIFAVFFGCSSKKAVVKKDISREKKKETQDIVKTKPLGGDVIVALLPFKSSIDDQDAREKARKLFKLINSLLSSNDKFKIIEQHKLEEILYEISSGYTGIADASTASQVGKLLGVSIIVCGSFAVTDDGVLLSIQLVDVGTGKVIGDAIEWDGDISTFNKFVKKTSREITTAVKKKK
ncbi:MAG: hypothetical protein JW983_03380 [Elusimicrobia bacterium]|nr:hypothetical protein [Elusimicrobiota bacterium]